MRDSVQTRAADGPQARAEKPEPASRAEKRSGGRETERCLFVAGPGRSGTTLLTLVLSAHPAVCLSPETAHLVWAMRQGGECLLEGGLLREFRQVVENDAKLHGLKADLSDYHQRVAAYERISVREAVLDFLRSWRDAVKPEASVIGQKKNYLDFWRDLKGTLPEAAIVAIFRDPRSTAVSAARNLPGQSVISASRSWAARAAHAQALAHAHPADYLEIRYEDFVAETEAACRDMCGFLGLDFDPAMLSHHEANRTLQMVTRGQESKHVRTAAPVNAARVGSWREGADPADAALVEMICGPVMESRGYSVELLPGLGIGERLNMHASLTVFDLKRAFRRLAGKS